MYLPTTARILGATWLVGLAGTALAADPGTTSNSSLQSQIDSLRATVKSQAAEIHDLKDQKGETWLNQERTDEVKAVVKEVLADSDTRSSLMASGMTAGHNGSNFFLASEDNTFLMMISGQLQVRYEYNNRHTASPSTTEANESGFDIHRAKITFDGYVGNPKIEYKIQLAADRNTDTEQLEDAWLAYSVTDDFKVFAGRFHDTFARESLMSSRYQQTNSRTLVDYVWANNDDYVEGVGLEWKILPDHLIYSMTFNDGNNSGSTGSSGTGVQTGFQNTGGHDFDNSSTEFAVTSRMDLKLLGDWKNIEDVESWSDNVGPAGNMFGAPAAPGSAPAGSGVPGPQWFMGGAVHYELAKSGDEQASGRFVVTPPGDTTALTYGYNSFIQWTGDTIFKAGPFSLMAAGYGWHFFPVTDPSKGLDLVGKALDNYAATVQAGYFVIPDKLEPFVRGEWIGVDSNLHSNDLTLLTSGVNWFFRKHSLKVTTDVVWALNNVNSANTFGASLTGPGLLADDPKQNNQVLVRSQVQLLF